MGVRETVTYHVFMVDVMPVAWRCSDLLLVCNSNRLGHLDFLFNCSHLCDFMINFNGDFLLNFNFLSIRDLLLSEHFDLDRGIDHLCILNLFGDLNLDVLHLDHGLKVFLLNIDNERYHHFLLNHAGGRDFDVSIDLDEFGHFDGHSLDVVLGDLDDAGSADFDGFGLGSGDLRRCAGAPRLAAATAALAKARALALVARAGELLG